MHSLRRGSILGLLLIAGAWTAQAQTNPKNLDTPNPRGSDVGMARGFLPNTSVHPELYQLWKTLPGRYERSDDGSRLTVTLTAVSPYVLFVEARTLSGGHDSVERGWIELGDASTSYTSARMRFALSYRPDSLRKQYECVLFGSPTPDGITFESEASDCSFPLGRRISKLKVDAKSGVISVSDPKDGDPTVLTRVSAR